MMHATPKKAKCIYTPKKLMQSNMCDFASDWPHSAWKPHKKACHLNPSAPQPPDCSAAVLSLWPGSLEATLTPVSSGHQEMQGI